MRITINESDKFNYIQECTIILKKEFKIGIYTDYVSIVKAYNICLDFYVSEFEKECLLFDSPIDVVGAIQMYSTIASDNSSAKTSNDNITLKRMLKFLFGELTKVNIKSRKPSIINDTNISRLWHLTNLIGELTQQIYTYFINNNSGCQFELFESFFGFTISDAQFAHTLNTIAEKAKTTNIGGFQYNPNNPLDDFFEVADRAFGKAVVDELLNSIHQIDAPIIIDSDQFSEKEFIEILSGKRSCEQIRHDPAEIVDLSDLYFKYPGNAFLQGLTLRGCEIDLKRNITHPHSNYARTRFRPIMELTVDGCKKYFSTSFMFEEAINEHVTNQIPFNILPKEWKEILEFKEYTKQQNEKRATWIEDYLEAILKKNSLSYLRNIKSINDKDLDKEPAVNGGNVGEIDFIVVDHNHKKLYVIECKCLKSYYDFPSFSLDKEKFEGAKNKERSDKKSYNNQLRCKFDWVSKNLQDVRAELERNAINLLDASYTVDCLFLTDSKSYYSLFSEYNILSRGEIENYLLSK